MIRETLPLWYGEAEPDGSWAGLVPDQHVLTDTGIVPLCPAGNTLFLRKRGNRLACQGQTGDNWLWDGSPWQNLGPSYGVSPVAFAPDGSVVQNTVAYGSQGIRWVDDAGVHTGDATYNSGPPLNLFEYTTHGDVTIGQGGDGGVMAVIESRDEEGRATYTRRVLIAAPAYCTFVRFNRTGDAMAVAIVIRGGLHLMWFTRQELNALPLDLPPVPVPQPIPEPAPVSTFREYPDVPAAVDRDYPDLRRHDEGGFCDQCAHRCNKRDAAAGLPPRRWGRKRKNDGSMNTDIVAYMLDPADLDKKKMVDVLTGDARNPSWNLIPENEEHGNGTWAPPQSADRDEQIPDEPDEPTDPPQSEDSLALLRAQVNAMQGGIAANFQAMSIRYDELLARVEALEKKPAGTLPKLRARGSTSRSLYHSHSVDLEVVPE